MKWLGLIAVLSAVGCTTDETPKNPFPVSASDDTATTHPSDDTARPQGSDDTGPLSPDDTASDCDACPASTVSAMWSLDATAWGTDRSRTRANPLKGFMTSYLWGAPVTDFPDQLEFLYIPMNQVWGPDGDTIEEGLEPLMAAAAARHHHVVLRIFVDYPNRPTGLPEHLSETVSCSPYTEHGGGCSPDYDHPDMVAAMVGLIEALGDRYNGDPRLGFVQLGLLGFWGEWHTWPHGDWFPSEATQNAVLDAYESAFTQTHLQARYPSTGMATRSVGYHDDSFAHSTLGTIEWFFYPRMVAAGAEYRWQQMAIGGELRPELQGEVFSDAYTLGEYAQDMNECIDTTHASYLLNYYAFNGEETGYTGDERDRAEAAALRMGYEFELRGAALRLADLDDTTVRATVIAEVEQTGVAPFYYALAITIDGDGMESPAASGDDLSTLLPGERRTIEIPLGRIPVERVSEPWTVSLTGPMIQSGQRVQFATETPWTDSDGNTVLQWDPQCMVDGEAHPVGSMVAVSGHDCECRCDVDGAVRDCGGTICDTSVPQ